MTNMKNIQFLIVLAVAIAVVTSGSFNTGINLWDLWRNEDDFGELDLNNYILYMLEDLKEGMKEGIPEYKIPVMDPFYFERIEQNVSQTGVNVHLLVEDLNVTGLSEFIIDEFDFNLKALLFKLHLHIPLIRIDGNYLLQGKVAWFFSVSGNGTFWIEAENLTVGIDAKMAMNEEERLQIQDDFDVDVKFDSVKLHFENLLGGGAVGNAIQSLINTFGKTLFDFVLPMVKSNIKNSILGQINGELKKLPIKALIPGNSANEYVDQFLANLVENEEFEFLDPFHLPEFYSNFSQKILLITYHGEAVLFNGTLVGLSTLRRTGDCELKANNRTITVSANLGINNLSLSYEGKAKFMDLGPDITLAGGIKRMDLYFRLSQSNLRGSHPVLEEFVLKDMAPFKVEITGLGMLSWITSFTINNWSIFLKKYIAEKLTEIIKEKVNEKLSEIRIPIG